MKKLITVIVFLISVSINAQTNVPICLEYMTTNYPGSSWVLQDDGSGVYIRYWQSALAKPTMAQVYAVWPNASVWKSNQVIEAKSNYDTWKTQQVDGETLADAFKALIVCINKRLPATNRITAVEFKLELKQQLQE